MDRFFKYPYCHKSHAIDGALLKKAYIYSIMPGVDMITILGHTAGGKTAIAARVAYELGGEVISADSRQVYRDMNLGTGKDYDDYTVKAMQIPYHLIDIVDAGYAYNLFEYQQDFKRVYEAIRGRERLPVLCGGSGLYIESVLRNYHLMAVPVNPDLRKELSGKSLEQLSDILSGYRALHNTTDIENKKRAIRAIEIEDYIVNSGATSPLLPPIRSRNFGIRFSRENRRSRITKRLISRLEEGMVDEVKRLLDSGVSHERLQYYGLEYKYLSAHIRGELTHEEMFNRLNTAIHQFSKRQMTYFRGMERRGIKIHWLEGELGTAKLVKQMLEAI